MPPGTWRSARARKAVSNGVSATRTPTAATFGAAEAGWPKVTEWEPVTLPPAFRHPPYTYPAAIFRPIHGGTPTVEAGQGGRTDVVVDANYSQIETSGPRPRCEAGLHEMTPANTRRTRDGRPRCRACYAADLAAYVDRTRERLARVRAADRHAGR